MSSEMVARAPLILACVGLGMLLTWQAPMNAEAARRFASPMLAALLSLTVSVLIVSVGTLASVRSLPAPTSLAGAPWWMWVGGACGAIFLIVSLAIVPRIGTVVFLLAVIFGQMIGAVLADSFGLFGLPVQQPSPGKLAGLGLVLVGAIVYQLAN